MKKIFHRKQHAFREQVLRETHMKKVHLEIVFFKNRGEFNKTLCNKKQNLCVSLLRQEVQGLQAFAFSVVTVNYEHTKPRIKRKRRG